MRHTLPIAALTLTLVVVAGAADWPQWRGPNRDGIVRESRLPTRWPEKLPAPRWRVTVGDGYTSPTVADGRVFILARPDDGKEACLCFDQQTGKELWRITYPQTFRCSDARAGRGPNSTPTVDGDRVYMLGLSGMFHCVEVKTGRVLWKHDFLTEYWGVEKDESNDDAWFPACGTAASPLVVGSHVIVPVGGKKAGAVSAFDRNTGKLLWSALPERSSYASPILADLAGTRQIVAFTGLRMVGLDASTRKLLWEYPFPAMYQQTVVSPLVWKNRVTVGGELKPTVALEVRRAGAGFAADVAWKNPSVTSYIANPIIVKDHLYGLSENAGRLYCVEMATGKTTWESEKVGSFVSLLAAGDQLLALNSRGELHVFKTDPKTCTPVTSLKVSDQGATWSLPAVSGSQLLIKDRLTLISYDLS